MKKILFVVPSLSKGGAERMVTRISTQLAKDDNFEVSVLYFFDTENNYQVGEDVKTYNLFGGDEIQYNNVSKIKRILAIRKFIKKLNPDYIVPFLNHVCFYVFISLFFTRYIKKIYCTERANPILTPRKFLRRMIIKNTGKFIVQNQGQKEYFSKKIQKKTVVIPNFVEDSLFETQKIYNSKIENIVFLGRLSEEKNIPLLIEAFSELNSNEVKLHIYGHGNNEKYLRIAEKSKKKDQIIFEGRTEKAKEVLLESDLFVLSSNYEGMPNVLMEAMALGVPCISTDCDYGPRDLLINNENGILVPVDNKNTLRDAIQYLIDNPEIAVKYGKTAKESVKKIIGKDINIQKWKDLFI